jgi:hypothetical protein
LSEVKIIEVIVVARDFETRDMIRGGYTICAGEDWCDASSPHRFGIPMITDGIVWMPETGRRSPR